MGQGVIRMKYVIKNVNLYQGKIDSHIIEHSNVYFENDIIVRIDTGETIEDGYEVIDGTDKYLLPGLINLHAHLFGSGKPSKILGSQSKLQQFVIKAAATNNGVKILDKLMQKNMELMMKFLLKMIFIFISLKEQFLKMDQVQVVQLRWQLFHV